MVVATWNLENLLRPASESGPRDEGAYAAKLAELARVIGELAPDVLGVQEIGGLGPLEDLRDRLGGDWHAASSELPDGRGIRVGFLSRLGLGDVTHVGDFPEWPAARPGRRRRRHDRGDGPRRAAGARARRRSRHRPGQLPPEVQAAELPQGVQPPRREPARARYGAYALYRRAAEATTVRAYANDLLDDQGQERAVIVLGDLNDVPAAATTQILLGPPGSEIDTAGFERPDQGDGSRLWNLAPLIPEQRRYSRRFRGRGELIDHILVSHALVQRVEDVDTAAGEPPSITENPAQRRDEPASDHLPVVARFDLG